MILLARVSQTGANVQQTSPLLAAHMPPFLLAAVTMASLADGLAQRAAMGADEQGISTKG